MTWQKTCRDLWISKAWIGESALAVLVLLDESWSRNMSQGVHSYGLPEGMGVKYVPKASELEDVWFAFFRVLQVSALGSNDSGLGFSAGQRQSSSAGVPKMAPWPRSAARHLCHGSMGQQDV